MSRTVAVVSGGLRNPSSTKLLADRLAAAVRAALAETGDVEIRTVDLREHATAITNALLTGVSAPQLAEAMQTVMAADGVVAVTPIFSGSYSGLFKSFFDLLGDGSLAGTPVLLAATAGTPRHSLAIDHAMRPLFAYLRAVVVPTGVFAATDDFGSTGPTDDDVAPLGRRIDRAAAELAGLVTARGRTEVRDEFEDFTAFEDLLGS